MSSTFYAITPFQHSDQEIVGGCGVVEGRVVDETGHPVAVAKVSSMITDRPPRGRLMSSLTDAQGRFTLTCFGTWAERKSWRLAWPMPSTEPTFAG